LGKIRKGTGDVPMNVKFNNRDPVYLQVVRHFKEEIATGKLAAGQEIPSRRELAGLFQINPNTAQRAYKEMELQSLITTEGNSPSRITKDEGILNLIRSELLQEAVDVFVGSVIKIAVSMDELLLLVKEKYESERVKPQEDDL
jgi:GntR family transcriptional regulator